MTKLLEHFKRIAVGVALIGSAFGFLSSAWAWDGMVRGKVTQLDLVPSDSNYSFRVYLLGYPNLCGSVNWAYLNDTDSNYNALVAGLMAAKSSNSDVMIYTTLVGGYCHIGYISTF
jgi:hypothetical protein